MGKNTPAFLMILVNGYYHTVYYTYLQNMTAAVAVVTMETNSGYTPSQLNRYSHKTKAEQKNHIT